MRELFVRIRMGIQKQSDIPAWDIALFLYVTVVIRLRIDVSNLVLYDFQNLNGFLLFQINKFTATFYDRSCQGIFMNEYNFSLFAVA